MSGDDDDRYAHMSAGRCRSGKRWFWYAAVVDYDCPHCDDPVCAPGLHPHEHGWEDTEDQALTAMSEACARLGGKPGLQTGRALAAAKALKRINAAKRRARPPKPGAASAAPVEYLYEPWSWTDYDNPPYETRKGIAEIPIVKKTPKRIYYDDTGDRDRENGVVTLGYIDRLEFETDTRCRQECPVGTPGTGCAAHGYAWPHCPHGHRPGECHHGSPAGQADRPGYRWYGRGGTFFATREVAEEDLYRWEREQERKRREAGPELRRLRTEMAAAHPDRGGTNEGFMAARKRYEQALRQAS